MDLSEVQKEMVPGVIAALRRGMGLDEAREAFTLTALKVAMEESGDVQSVVAKKLGVSEALVSLTLSGKAYTRFRSRKKPPEQK